MTSSASSRPWHRHPLPWICAAALVLRLATLAFEPPMVFDEGSYRAIATHLLAGDGYTDDGRGPETYWMPLAVALHVVAQLLSSDVHVARALWALLGAASVAVAFLLGRQLFGERAGLVFAGLMAVYPYNLIFGMSASTEIPNVLLLLLTAWLLARRAHPLAIGLSYGLACLCRAPNLALLPLVLWWAGQPQGRLRRTAWFLAGFLVCAAPWSIRNSLIEKTFVPLSAGGLRNAWLGTNPWYRAWTRGVMDSDAYGAKVYAVCDPLRTTYAEQQRAYRTALLEFARTQPGEFVRLLAYKTLRFWAPATTTSRVKGAPFLARHGRRGYLVAAAVGLVYLAVLAAAVAAVVVAWRRGGLLPLGPLLIWMGFGYAANIWFDVLVRFRYTSGVEICLLLLAAWFVVHGRAAKHATA